MPDAALMTTGSVDRIADHVASIEHAAREVEQRRRWWQSGATVAYMLEIMRRAEGIEVEMRQAQERFESEDARFERYRREQGDR